MNRVPLRLPLLLATAASIAFATHCSRKSSDHPNLSVLQLSASSYPTSEAMRSVMITVTRTARTAGAVTVDYATADDSATAGFDYHTTSGTLSWADGDGTEKTFTIPLREDNCPEGAETLHVSLANPTGSAGLGFPSAAVVTIADNDTDPPGSLDLGFGTGGVIADNPSPDSDIYATAAADGSFLYVAGWDERPGAGDWQWRIEKRSLSDGSPDPGFGPGGLVESNPSPGPDSPYAMAIHSGCLYITGDDGTFLPTDWQWRIEKRSLADGSLDGGFGNNGVLTINPSAGDDTPFDLAADGSFIYVVGYDESPGTDDWQWRIEKRSLADGTPDPCFGTGGVVTSDPSYYQDKAWWIAADGRHLYIVGQDETAGPGDPSLRIEKRLK